MGQRERADKLLDDLDRIEDAEAWRSLMAWFAGASGASDSTTIIEAVVRRAKKIFSPAAWEDGIKSQADAIARTFDAAGLTVCIGKR